MFDALEGQCGGGKKLKALGWPTFTKLVDSALEAGVIKQINDGGIRWLTLKAPTNTNNAPVNHVPVASRTTAILTKEAKVETATASTGPIVAATATVQDPEAKLNTVPAIQPNAQAHAKETTFVSLDISAQGLIGENTIPVERPTPDTIPVENTLFTREVCVTSLKWNHAH